ncbi:MAG: hypothetical protein ACE5SW_12660 [Nitrososphaeraceae archaeon]
MERDKSSIMSYLPHNMIYPRFYLHYSVRNYRESSLFSRPETWEIFDILHTQGMSGLTAQDIHTILEKRFNTSVSKSKIYALLKQLYEGNWLKRQYNQNQNAQVYTVDYHWGGWGEKIIDLKFDNIVKRMASYFLDQQLFPVFEEYLARIKDELFKENHQNWIPAGNENFCNQCNINHNAEEFFNSLLDIATMEYLESERFKKFLQKNNYSK